MDVPACGDARMVACVDLGAVAGGLGLFGLLLGTAFGFVIHGWESWD